MMEMEWAGDFERCWEGKKSVSGVASGSEVAGLSPKILFWDDECRQAVQFGRKKSWLQFGHNDFKVPLDFQMEMLKRSWMCESEAKWQDLVWKYVVTSHLCTERIEARGMYANLQEEKTCELWGGSKNDLWGNSTSDGWVEDTEPQMSMQWRGQPDRSKTRREWCGGNQSRLHWGHWEVKWGKLRISTGSSKGKSLRTYRVSSMEWWRRSQT